MPDKIATLLFLLFIKQLADFDYCIKQNLNEPINA